MTISLNGTSGITTPTYGGATTAEYQVPVTAFKNRIINGGMMIDQRNAGASVTNAGLTYTLDRWLGYGSVVSKFSTQQNAGSVTPPTGFSNYLGCTSLSAYSVGSTDEFDLIQRIEGYNVADLAWGTANAKTVTLSFQVYSSLTGTFGGAINNSGSSRSYPFSYSIPVANTWTSISITIPGDTSGTWLTTNGIGIQVLFSLGAGSSKSGTANTWASAGYTQPTGATSVVGTNGATFYITGVQLEKGSTATSFDYRPYGTELALCQRYYQTYTQPPLRGTCNGTTSAARCGMVLPVVMRAAPTATVGAMTVFDGSVTTTISSIASFYLSTTVVEFDLTLSSSVTVGRPASVIQSGSTSMTISAEL